MRPIVEGMPACIRRSTYEGLDDPGYVLMITGWRSPEDRRPAVALIQNRVNTVLQSLGVKVERFNGLTT